MASKQEARIGLYYDWQPQDGYADQMDINIRTIAFLLNPAVINRTVTAPPALPVDGDAYIIAATGASGAYVGKENWFAVYSSAEGNWLILPPKDGMEAVVISEGTWGTKIVFKGGGWSPGTALA